LALAAHELGELDCFYCSLFDAPGKWGRRLSWLFGVDALSSRRMNGLPPEKVSEYPWPLLWHEMRKWMHAKSANDWAEANGRFDGYVANLVSEKDGGVFIGVETCAAESFRVAHEHDMKLVYDCPGFNPELSGQIAHKAALALGLPPPNILESSAIKAMKEKELALADHVLVYSEVHQRSWEQRGVGANKFVRIPLWIEPSLWLSKSQVCPAEGPLRVLFAGRGTLLKGFPYLLDAVGKCGRSVLLSVVGQIQEELQSMAATLPDIKVCASVPKSQLREHYWKNDVLVLPSLGDSFGFVALEAMACGLPVVVTENCGVPVPEPAWRVPIMNSDAIAQRLEYYVNNRDALKHDGQVAAEFARRFTPERYREQIKNLLLRLLRQ
jgi:glycosyltransferase involved in cell wall biosynthesis